MPATAQGFSVASRFSKPTDTVRPTYDAILKASRRLGPLREDPKKTSIHLVRQTAFARVTTRKDALILTLKSDHSVHSARVHKAEQASRNRWHLEIRVTTPQDVDDKIREWISNAYAIASG